jgi:hypothetical protein
MLAGLRYLTVALPYFTTNEDNLIDFPAGEHIPSCLTEPTASALICKHFAETLTTMVEMAKTRRRELGLD